MMASAALGLLLVISSALLLSVTAQTTPSTTCPLTSSYTLPTTYKSCRNLTEPTGNQGRFLFTYSNVTNVLNATYAMQPEQTGGWTAWGINKQYSQFMVPSDAIACFPDASGVPVIKQYTLTATVESGVNLGGSLDVLTSSCVIDPSTTPPTYYMEFSIKISDSYYSGPGQVYMIYGKGPGVDTSTFALTRHNPIDNLAQKITLTTGLASAASNGANLEEKNKHGIVSALGWGIFIPLAGMISRYMRPLNPKSWVWLRLHQLSVLIGFCLGVVGFGLGVDIYTRSGNVRWTHFKLGISIFVFACVQILLGIIRPHPGASLRFTWNCAHHLLGYALIAISIVNVFYGFKALETYGDWRKVYIVIIAFMGGVSLLLEIFTWFLYFTRKPEEETTKLEGESAGEDPMMKASANGTAV